MAFTTRNPGTLRGSIGTLQRRFRVSETHFTLKGKPAYMLGAEVISNDGLQTGYGFGLVLDREEAMKLAAALHAFYIATREDS